MSSGSAADLDATEALRDPVSNAVAESAHVADTVDENNEEEEVAYDEEPDEAEADPTARDNSVEACWPRALLRHSLS